MPITDVQAIDVHAHLGIYRGAPNKFIDDLYSGGVDVVVGRAKKANTAISIVSSLRALLPRNGGDPIRGNAETAKEIANVPELLQWAVVDPLKPETYTQALEMLESPKCVGVKIHPEEHGYPIKERGREIFEFAGKHNIILETHSGEQNSMPEDFLVFADDFPGVKIILAHLGCGWDNDLTHQVQAIRRSKHGNIFTDTSSAKQITPGLLEWAAKEIGADRILYGTDTPLYFSPMHRARIDHADLSDEEKTMILRTNALTLFRLTKS
jgi:predicted TIM-barrel fold metal-dependent hydrolase